MDADQFDTFVLSLNSAIPRRGALVGVLGTGLAALLTRFGIETAEAKRRKHRKKMNKCIGGKKKCGKQCFDLQSDAGHCGNCNAPCAASEICADGACTCPTGRVACGDGCVDVQTDAANCGACGNTCISAEICQSGACVCSAGTDECDETCVDLHTDAANCGACGKVCPSGGCVNGACTCPIATDCPETCTCSVRKEGGTACRGGVISTSCDADDDCPLGTYCLNSASRCTLPCLG
jgi:hypothetical protein